MSVLERTVREIMGTSVVEVRADLPVKDLIEVLEENQITGAPVVDDEGNVVGVVSTRDVLRLAARLLHRTGIHRALVFEDDRLAGVLSLRDVVAAVADAAGE